MRLEKVIFNQHSEDGLNRLVLNTRPTEQWAYLLGEISEDSASVRDFVHDASTQGTSTRVEPDWRYLLKAYEFKKRIAPYKVDIVGWFHSHPIDNPSDTDINSQKRFQKLYKPSFACFMNYNSLEMKCFYVVEGNPIFIPLEIT